MNPTNILYLEPLGKIHGSHVTPTDHTHFKIDKLVDYEEGGASGEWVPPYDVAAPADGIITHVEVFPFNRPPAGMTGIVEDYRTVIWRSCGLSSIFIHLNTRYFDGRHGSLPGNGHSLSNFGGASREAGSRL